ncbi:DUF1302 family protein [Limnochorda pilosa]|uniref:Uncharacterized protein n=1 Tax=Limnochorda pilosa TaxID=1555112 RepID=A0A0K2SJK9_LIMPI|nr:DUF1302 family protein [Limnochorda pilosa]BAS27298.1 hypothetical protein LIP_1449 [Limnochorda pilosa]
MTHGPTDRWTILRPVLVVTLAAALVFVGPEAVWASGVGYVGSVSPRITLDPEDGWRSVPDAYRLAQLALFSSTDRFGWYLSGSAESRGGNQEIDLALGEAYVDAYLPRVDLRLGRQLVAWGTVDGNNPVDNLNPADLTLFSSATEPAEAKVPLAALRAVSYWGTYQDLRAELVLLPEFRGHGLPESPPLTFPVEEPEVDLLAPDWGVRVQRSFDRFDLALSYYDGHERMPTPDPTVPPSAAHYLPVQVLGLEGAVFDLGDLTLRGEAAYFLTADEDAFMQVKNPYLQYALQLEYLWGMETTLMLQYLGSHVTGIDSPAEEESQEEIPFRAGAPLFNLDSRAVALGLRHETTWLNVRPLALIWQGVLGLDRGGFLTGATLDLSLTDSLSLGLGARIARGLEGTPLAAVGQAGRVWTGVEYSF